MAGVTLPLRIAATRPVWALSGFASQSLDSNKTTSRTAAAAHIAVTLALAPNDGGGIGRVRPKAAPRSDVAGNVRFRHVSKCQPGNDKSLERPEIERS